MAREGDHSYGSVNKLNSSIALLQERFRQLQKMKELRQEKERILSQSEKCNPSSKSSQPIMFQLSPKQPHCPDSHINCGANSPWIHHEFTAHVTKFTDAGAARSIYNTSPIEFENSDSGVDTSLHL